MAQVENSLIGSSGSLVAAGFETAGYYLQSKTLDALGNGYGLALAAFLFAIGLITAVSISAMGGQYKFFRWLVVCPGLFFFVIFTRVDSTGVYWKFGASDHGGQLAQNLGQGVINTDTVPRVSWIFASWNRFSSVAIQGFVQALMLFKAENEREVEYLLTKSQKFRAILTLEVEDPDIAKFLSHGFLEPCGLYLNLHQQLLSSSPVFTSQEIRDQIEVIKRQPVMSSTDTNYRLVQTLIDRTLLDESWLPQANTQGQRVLHCDELWITSVNVLKRWGDQLASNIGDDQLRRLLDKFKQGGLSDEQARNEMLNTVAISSLLRMTQQVVPQMTNEGARAVRSQDLIMLDQEKRQGSRRHEPIDTAAEMKILNDNYEYQGKGEFLTLMLSLPYMQGFLLYFLAWLFPWFCFVLLIPGRHLTFLHWFGLWFWVKSWDIGIAIVLIIDDLLFYLMPAGTAISDDQVRDMTAALKLALSSDPSHSAQLYYTIMAGLLAAVPVLCGCLIKRGSGDALTALNQGFGQFSRQVGSSMASVMRTAGSSQLTSEMNTKFSAVYQDTLQKESAKVMEQIKSLRNPAAFAKFMEGQMQGKSTVGKAFFNSMAKQPISTAQNMVIDRLYQVGMADAQRKALNARYGYALSEEAMVMQARTRMYKAFPQEFTDTKMWDGFDKSINARITTDFATPYKNMWGSAFSSSSNDGDKAKSREPEQQRRGRR